MTEPTKDEVNRRIAEWFYPHFHDSGGGNLWVRNHDDEDWKFATDYTTDASAVLAAVERVCRERGCKYETGFDGTQHTVEFWGPKEVNTRVGCSAWPLLGKAVHDRFAHAAALALFAVLGGEEV